MGSSCPVTCARPLSLQYLTWRSQDVENCAVRGKLTVSNWREFWGGRSPRPRGSVREVPNTALFPSHFSRLIFRGKCAGKGMNGFSSLDEPHRKVRLRREAAGLSSSLAVPHTAPPGSRGPA